MTYRMPPEWAPQDRVFMAFPPDDGYAADARSAWAAVANAITDFEPVTMVVDVGDTEVARRLLSGQVEVVEAPLDDAWMRDMGPTFVHDEDGGLAAVDWVFNGWGQADWAVWDKDRHVGSFVAGVAGTPVVASPMVNEGGGIHIDADGVVLATETVQLGQGRNEDWTREQVEAELARTIGATEVVWLPRGLTRDYERYGTRGHVDIVACFVPDGRVLLHAQGDVGHPDWKVSRDLHRLLGQRFDLVPLPAPATLRDDEGWTDWSYVNHLVVNGGVIACSFDDPHDAHAAGILRDCYPGREVVTVDARPLFARGGGIHCITQQQPAPRKA